MTTKPSDTIYTKNSITGKTEKIIQRELSIFDDYIQFFVDSELEAFKAAYIYQHQKTRVSFSSNLQEWVVSVYD